MKKLNFMVGLGIIFVVSSIVIYTAHYFIFKDAEFIFRYFIAQLGFLPVNALLVTLLISSVLARRAQRERLQKTDILIGAFFSEMGTELLRRLLQADESPADELRRELLLDKSWQAEDFARARPLLEEHKFKVRFNPQELSALNDWLRGHNDLILRILENPALMEHESFTRMMWAVFHFCDELRLREDLTRLPRSDQYHIEHDANRALSALAGQWVNHMEYTKREYPYLYHIALRTNPFNDEIGIQVKE
ncbi:MAG: hypothetical protein Q4B48_04345 [Syntrophomonadaceae bacterium]|nr:hypothetical protein [Syntrophomonadaceae bacterium]